VIVIVADIGALVLFTATKAGIFPMPTPDRPIAVLLLVHANAVPVTRLDKIITGELSPLQ
jgi:hypothetical protein